MSKKSTPDGISRRKFMKGLSTGVVGSTVLIQSLPAISEQAEPTPHEGKILLSLTVNGKPARLLIEPRTTLAEVLRDQLQLTGTKIVCNQGECGACTVLLDGKAVYSCHLLALDAEGKEVTTIEGLMNGEKLHPIQDAFIEHDGYQCGFCTPGQVMAAQALLLKNPRPTKAEVMEGMSGNLCRCGAYPNIIDSVLAAAEKAMK
ncbi:MAG: (2Fe-2S)-binding protein [bacterium]|nr:(2Fe-2S)-binding protein [bacterium]